MRRVVMLLVLLLVLVGSLYYLSRQIEYTYHEPDIDKILQEKVTR